MTKPDSPNTADIVERLDYHHEHPVTGKLVLRNLDGPKAAAIITELREALEQIAAGSKLGTEMFEQRVRERKGRLTWHAVNVLQDNLAACEGTARAALKDHRKAQS